jgi:3-oxoacyl-(acyl-carrier-protein) synthase
MATEILEYFYTNEWNIESLKDLPFKEFINEKTPLIVSSMSSYKKESLTYSFDRYLKNQSKASPTAILDSWYGGFNRRISEYLGTTSEVLLLTSNCASSIYSLYIADLISLDKNQPVLVVCADNVTSDFDYWRFEKIGAIDNQSGYSFDKESKGFKMGIGLVVFLVKNKNVAFNYLDPKAIVNHYYFYTNNFLTNTGTSDELIKNLSGIDYSVFDLWNAHAPGTPLGDRIEYEYFSKVIKKNIPIVSYKSYIGHCMTASGGMEIALALDNKKDGKLLPNIIKTTKIVNDDRIITKPEKFIYNRMLKASLGFGGKIAIADISLI